MFAIRANTNGQDGQADVRLDFFKFKFLKFASGRYKNFYNNMEN